MRVGVIGCGSIGSRHARNLKAMGHEVVLHDENADALFSLANELGQCGITKTGGPFESLEPAAVLICTPAATHADVARGLLANGFRSALFCEKPLALSVEECEVFRSWPHVTTMTGYNLRFHPLIRTWKAMADAWVAGWFVCACDNRKYGNDYFELSHELDLACWFGVRPRPDLVDGECPYYLRRWHLERGQTCVTAEFRSPNDLGDQMYVDELAHFLACVEKQEPTMTPFADGIRVVQVCEDALKMAKVQA